MGFQAQVWWSGKMKGNPSSTGPIRTKRQRAEQDLTEMLEAAEADGKTNAAGAVAELDAVTSPTGPPIA